MITYKQRKLEPESVKRAIDSGAWETAKAWMEGAPVYYHPLFISTYALATPDFTCPEAQYSLSKPGKTEVHTIYSRETSVGAIIHTGRTYNHKHSLGHGHLDLGSQEITLTWPDEQPKQVEHPFPRTLETSVILRAIERGLWDVAFHWMTGGETELRLGTPSRMSWCGQAVKPQFYVDREYRIAVKQEPETQVELDIVKVRDIFVFMGQPGIQDTQETPVVPKPKEPKKPRTHQFFVYKTHMGKLNTMQSSDKHFYKAHEHARKMKWELLTKGLYTTD